MSINDGPSPLRIDPQPSLKIGKAERTRKAILNAALDFLWRNPFRDMTVTHIMASAGLSRSAFYPYFNDLHEVLEALLEIIQTDILSACEPWLSGVGDPVILLRKTLTGVVRVGYERGPFLRAISDAATADQRFHVGWHAFLHDFDNAAVERIEADQQQGLVPEFDARPVATALNRLDAQTLIEAFGQHPRREPEPVAEALARIWISTLYGREWVDRDTSSLTRE